jgi:S-methyl-5-thioribose-1-phosphate isomerase
MLVQNKRYKTLWMNGTTISLIDQNKLPYVFEILESTGYISSCKAIKDMTVRGAGAIGVCAGYAMAQAALEAPVDQYHEFISKARNAIEATRPTARNLFYATERVYAAAFVSPAKAVEMAELLAYEDETACKKIGEYGNSLIKDGMNIETHCNAGWLAFVDYGSALSPLYEAARNGKNIHVWVDETRPRNQGAKLTAWELCNENIPNTIIPDNAGAMLMMNGKVDMMIVGADRIAANGDTANKIGTLEKAIVAKEFGIPFYIAAPTSTIDLNCPDGSCIPIEERSEDEVLYSYGMLENATTISKMRTSAPEAKAFNPGFDVTLAKYITGIITEKGIFKPNEIIQNVGM